MAARNEEDAPSGEVVDVGDLGVEWGRGSHEGPSDRLSEPDSAGEEGAKASPPAPRSDDPALRASDVAVATEMTSPGLDERDMSRNIDGAVEIAERMLALGLVPKSVRVGTLEVHFAAYDKPRDSSTEDEPGKRRPKNYYDLDRELRGRAVK